MKQSKQTNKVPEVQRRKQTILFSPGLELRSFQPQDIKTQKPLRSEKSGGNKISLSYYVRSHFGFGALHSPVSRHLILADPTRL